MFRLFPLRTLLFSLLLYQTHSSPMPRPLLDELMGLNYARGGQGGARGANADMLLSILTLGHKLQQNEAALNDLLSGLKADGLPAMSQHEKGDEIRMTRRRRGRNNWLPAEQADARRRK